MKVREGKHVKYRDGDMGALNESIPSLISKSNRWVGCEIMVLSAIGEMATQCLVDLKPKVIEKCAFGTETHF